MSEKPLQTWIAAETSGKIVAAHCNCMAGMGGLLTRGVAALGDRSGLWTARFVDGDPEEGILGFATCC